MNSERTPHSSPWRASYGASFLSSLKIRYREISRAHCICFRVSRTLWVSMSPWRLAASKRWRGVIPWREVGVPLSTLCGVSTVHIAYRKISELTLSEGECPINCFPVSGEKSWHHGNSRFQCRLRDWYSKGKVGKYARAYYIVRYILPYHKTALWVTI